MPDPRLLTEEELAKLRVSLATWAWPGTTVLALLDHIAALSERLAETSRNLLLPQTISGWDGWPDDVRERLRQWNRNFLLSFQRRGDFRCAGCDRDVAAHENGNAVVRHHRKAHGVQRCEDCLIALAREHETPPDLRGDTRRGVGGER